MKRLLAVASLAALAGCARAPRRGAAVSPPLRLARVPGSPSPCLPQAMHAELLLPPGAPAQVVHEAAFRDYWEAVLDAQQQAEYVACLRRRWRLPWLHAQYRRGKRWLSESRAEAARDEPLAGRPIADVAESFSPAAGGATRRRVVIVFADGGRTEVDDTAPRTP